MSSWIYLALAIVFEVIGTASMKLSDGLTNWFWTAMIIIGYVISFFFMAIALKKIDVGVAYAIWSGFGTIMIVIIGYYAFGESFSLIKLGSIGLVVIGVVGLNLG